MFTRVVEMTSKSGKSQELANIFSRPNPRSEPLTSIPLSATTSPQKRPPKARHNRRTYHHERRVGSAPFL